MTLLDGPDPTQPDEPFRDAEHQYVVQVSPALAPYFGSQTGSTQWNLGTTLVQLGFVLGTVLVSRWLDDRWKVVVSRHAGRLGASWQVVHVEFVAASELAEERRAQLLRSWEPGAFEQAAPMHREQLRRLRRTPV